MNVQLTSKEALINNDDLLQELKNAEEEEKGDGKEDSEGDYGEEELDGIGGDMNQGQSDAAAM